MIFAYPKLIAAVLVALGLVFSHGWVYHEGKVSGKKVYDKALAEQTEQALQHERLQREKEQALIAEKQQAEVRYEQVKRAAANAATGALSELDRLRHTLAAREARAAGANSATCASPDARAAESELFGACAGAITQLAAEADGIRSQLIGLQAYVKQVCLKP